MNTKSLSYTVIPIEVQPSHPAHIHRNVLVSAFIHCFVSSLLFEVQLSEPNGLIILSVHQENRKFNVPPAPFSAVPSKSREPGRDGVSDIRAGGRFKLQNNTLEIRRVRDEQMEKRIRPFGGGGGRFYAILRRRLSHRPGIAAHNYERSRHPRRHRNQTPSLNPRGNGPSYAQSCSNDVRDILI